MRVEMLYTQIRAFDAVARAGSFVAAAELLGVSQPALSIQVKALEERHGMRLFDRRGRKIRLTRDGRELLLLSRQFFGLEGQIEGKLTAGKSIGDRQLKLAFDGPHITMPMLAEFRRRHPEVELVVSMGNTRTVRQLLLDQQVDLAVLPRIGEEPRIFSAPLCTHQPVVIVGTAHRWHGRRKLSIQDLSGWPMVTREPGSNTQRCVDEGFARAGIEPRIALRLGSREALIEAVAANIGFGIIWACEAVASNRVLAIPLRNSGIESTDYLACHRTDLKRSLISAFFAMSPA